MLPEDSVPSAPASTPPTVGVLGVGSMGSPIALSLLRASAAGDLGPVWVHSRRQASATAALSEGAQWAHTAGELGRAASIVFVALPGLEDLESLLGGAHGLLSYADTQPLTIVITSTCAPDAMRQFARTVAAVYPLVTVVDAPISGGVEAAQRGELSVLVGCDSQLPTATRTALAAIGEAVELGGIGAGQVAKACNQMIVGATSIAIAEAAVIGERSGLDLSVLLPLLNRGYAASAVLTAKMPKLINRDYSPDGKATFMQRDLAFAKSQAVLTETRASQLDAGLEVFAGLVAAGLGDDDLAVVHQFVDNEVGHA